MLTASVSVAGYVVQPELKAVSTLQSAGPRSLFDGAAVYSFRRSGTLLAVLEIGEFLPSSDVVSPDFQAEVVGQVGESVPQRTHELGRIVYEGTANSQSIFMWFDGRRLMVLLVHDIDNPRGFLQSVLRSLA
jgi:hypothetical protein